MATRRRLEDGNKLRDFVGADRPYDERHVAMLGAPLDECA
jgi:hypothetical protein